MTRKELHLIPLDRKEHTRSGDCWCKPVLNAEGDTWVHDVYKPVIEECTNVEEVSAYFTKITGQTPHAAMLKASIGPILKVIVARDDGKIDGMAAYAMVANPFVSGIGYALLVDLQNGYTLEPSND